MIDFKVIVKVDPEDPKKSLRTLGREVCLSEHAFENVELEKIRKEEYITAVPIEIALFTEERNVIMARVPECRFIVTGVQTSRLAYMKEELGYRLVTSVDIPHIPVGEEDIPVREDIPVENEEGQCPTSAGQDVKVSEDGTKLKVAYYVNGKEVSEKEFEEHKQALALDLDFPEIFNSLRTLFQTI